MLPIEQRRTVREILELSLNPTPDEIKRNFRRLCKEYHPDINKDPKAAEYMKKINVAFEIATGKRRVQYQQPRPQPAQYTQTIYVHFSTGNVSYTWSGTNGTR